MHLFLKLCDDSLLARDARSCQIQIVYSCIYLCLHGLARSSLEVLGVSFSDRLDFSEHFKVVCAKAARSIYALEVLRAHGLQGANLWQICKGYHHQLPHLRSTCLVGLYTDACSRLRLQSVFNRLRRFGLLPPEFTTYEEVCEHLCGELFRQVLHNRIHVLH